MGHVVREAGFCVIDIDTVEGRIFLQERWQYAWLTSGAVTPWTLAEKRAFHHSADRAIWAAWSNRVLLNVAGTSPFAVRFNGRGIPINLDIRWVTANPHWNVNVTKIPAGTFRVSNVQWAARIINLDTEDFTTRTICGGTPRVCDTQTPVAHEFGHAAGNTAVLARGDEYPASSPNVNDHASILNHGHALRRRHFRTILDELNRMIPHATFSVRSV
jgi:hypothetical protein